MISIIAAVQPQMNPIELFFGVGGGLLALAVIAFLAVNSVLWAILPFLLLSRMDKILEANRRTADLLERMQSDGKGGWTASGGSHYSIEEQHSMGGVIFGAIGVVLVGAAIVYFSMKR